MDLVGQTAPDFTAWNPKFEAVTLASRRGRKVVIAFFPAVFTSVCTEEMCTFRDALAELEGLGVDVLAISVDGPTANGAFAEANGLTFPVLSDWTRAATHAYGVAWPNFGGMPGYVVANRAVFVVGPDGAVTWQWVGEHPGQMPPFDAMKAALR